MLTAVRELRNTRFPSLMGLVDYFARTGQLKRILFPLIPLVVMLGEKLETCPENLATLQC